MKKISSTSTFVNKRIFPALFAIGFLIVLTTALRDGAATSEPLRFLPVVMLLAIGVFVMKQFVFNLVDEVYLGKETLQLRFRGQEDTIPLSDIINVNWSRNARPPRVALRLRKPCRFGDEILRIGSTNVLFGESGEYAAVVQAPGWARIGRPSVGFWHRRAAQRLSPASQGRAAAGSPLPDPWP